MTAKRARRVVTWCVIITLLGMAPVWTPIHLPQPQPTPSPIQVTSEQRQANRTLAKKYAWVAFGWRAKQWQCLDYIYRAESSYNHLADNPDSTAFGIGQMLGETSRRPDVQILRSLAYIADRYGTPCAAKKFHIRKGYY